MQKATWTLYDWHGQAFTLPPKYMKACHAGKDYKAQTIRALQLFSQGWAHVTFTAVYEDAEGTVTYWVSDGQIIDCQAHYNSPNVSFDPDPSQLLLTF